MLADVPNDHDHTHLYGALKLFDGRRTCLDCGAHRGTWTKTLKEHFSRVYAFEPWAANADKNTYADVLFRFAVGEKFKTMGFEPGHENTGQYHLTEGEGMQVVPLDAFDWKGVDFIKFDVEGYEYFAIKGALKTIEKNRPAIMIEENFLCERYGLEQYAASGLLESLRYKKVGTWGKDHLFLPR